MPAELSKVRKLKKDEIKKYFPKEDVEFSDYVAKHIGDLNELLGLQIEIDTSQEPVDNFRLDLSGTEIDSQLPTVIELQMNESDHDHLGKLITYSAGKEAGIVIWIATSFQSAHKDAVLWLNDITDKSMRFYAITFEMLKIGELVGPHFSIAAEPPHSKLTLPKLESTERQKKYLEFWDEFRSKLASIDPHGKFRKPPASSYYSVSVGRSGFWVGSSFTQDGRFSVHLGVDTGDIHENEEILKKLAEHKEQVETQIGQGLNWANPIERRLKHIDASVEGSIDDSEKLIELIEWGAPLFIKIRNCFSPR